MVAVLELPERVVFEVLTFPAGCATRPRVVVDVADPPPTLVDVRAEPPLLTFEFLLVVVTVLPPVVWRCPY